MIGDPFDPDVQVESENAQYDKNEQAKIDLDAQLRRRKQAYGSVFGNASPEDIEYVLLDLATFARAFSSRYHDNPRKQDILEGRAEVVYRIMEALEIEHDALYQKYYNLAMQQGTLK
jgi:hypothetical protein